MTEAELWRSRFMWLWERASDGFGTPSGWWIYDGDPPTEEDLRRIDAWIADSTSAEQS